MDEVACSLRVAMQPGSLTATEEQIGPKYDTIGTWLRCAGEHAVAVIPAMMHHLHLTEVEVDAFWSLAQRSRLLLDRGQTRWAGWVHAGAA